MLNVTTLVDGPEILECKGIQARHHTFLKGEECHVCSDCQVTACRFCHTNEKELLEGEDNILCLECICDQFLGVAVISEVDMRDCLLKKKGAHVPVAATCVEVKQLHEEHDSGEHGGHN